MFQIGSIVMHPSAGVCNIEDIREEKFTESKRTYYIMHPVSESNNSTTIYVPVDTDKIHLRKLMGKDEIIDIIKHSTTEKIEWIDNTNLRKAAYSEILHSDDTSKIIALITVLHTKKERTIEAGKKFSAYDEKILHDAEKKIHQEFSHALSMQEEEIPRFIITQLSAETV
ncbi:MAG: CarD family transcriptional regulator [Lachnospiraceae bacterium]|nr:CarD family transcriptional regulator [Lachnospiraceae bacterium]MDE7200638.1 CarD family transcriptional regulator [Lachnospiraceae bacterium]